MSSTQPTITIFEGPDGAGKSVAARAWLQRSQRQEGTIEHHGPYLGEEDIASKYRDSMLPAYARFRSVVLDRSWLSEPIYAAAFRGGTSRVGVGQRRILERLALSRQGVVVLCLPKKETVLANWAIRNGRGEEYLTGEAAAGLVYDLYQGLKTALPVVAYDYQAADAGGLYDHVEAARGAPADGPGAGRWLVGSQVLLIGDRLNAVYDEPRVPLGGLDAGGCSVWLAERLEEAGIPETALYWANAFRASGGRTDGAFVKRLRPRAVITLGGEAGRWCRDNYVKYYSEAHPQFWKRFHHHEPYPLINLIKEILHE